MPRYNVETDGEWACFSSIADAFLTPFMSVDDYEKYRDTEYGSEKLPLEQSNKMTLREALFNLSCFKSDDDILDNLRFAGLICEKEDSEE